ncbi:hypothetical protein FJ208_01760, partial [Candidatus Gribaldobacteria bacterium]|nr:hypothetical protein [Candidatus Gribaldobacteria bacterium]
SAERELVAQGKLPNRTKLLCLEALSAGYYTKPKPWSEYCETECLAGLTEECNACLRKCEGTSFLAKLNCEIYLLANDPTCQAGGINCCGVECSSGFNASCENCLCKDPITQKPLSQEKCLMKVCAGSLENYMCCYK